MGYPVLDVSINAGNATIVQRKFISDLSASNATNYSLTR